MLSVNDFINMIVDPASFNIELYDSSSGETKYEGKANKIPNKYLSSTVFSIDSPGSYRLCININSGFDKET